MLKKLAYLLRLFIFWLIFFQFHRLVFVIYNKQKFAGLKLSEISSAFYHALPLDFSAAGYLISIPFLAIIISNYLLLDKSVVFIRWFNFALVGIVTILQFVDTALYHEWGYKLNAYALSFTKYPKEVMASVAATPYLTIIIILTITVAAAVLLLQAGVHLYDYVYKRSNVSGKKQHLLAVLYTLGTCALLFLFIRGSVGVVPINQSAVFYSHHAVLNHTAVNTPWNIMYSVFNTGGMMSKNPYRYMEMQEAEKITRSLYVQENYTDSNALSEVNQPNVLVILLESWTADVIESLGGEKGVTDGFHQLSKDGLLFTNIYASGDRTDKGIVAVLSGYPSQPSASIISQPEKMEKLPVITAPFVQQNYSTAFYYGGESEFANMRAYLFHSGFEKIIDKNSFEKKDMNSKWGAHDGIVFNRLIKDLNKVKEPFFYSLLTLSSHEPFEIPVKHKFPKKKEEDKFRNAVWYSDLALKEFMDNAQQQTWYNNTLIILVADHGHRLPKNYVDLSVPGRFRIPLLITGGALKPELRGTKCKTTGSQTDIAATLLQSLGKTSKQFPYSKNLLSKNAKSFAWYTYNDGFGWIDPYESLVFDNIGKRISYPYHTVVADSSNRKIKLGQAYLQSLMQDYIEK
jgi:phosphoglycerol transferase MdoB-like AlkP superfamily enzyme